MHAFEMAEPLAFSILKVSSLNFWLINLGLDLYV